MTQFKKKISKYYKRALFICLIIKALSSPPSATVAASTINNYNYLRFGYKVIIARIRIVIDWIDRFGPIRAFFLGWLLFK